MKKKQKKLKKVIKKRKKINKRKLKKVLKKRKKIPKNKFKKIKKRKLKNIKTRTVYQKVHNESLVLKLVKLQLLLKPQFNFKINFIVI